MHILCDSQNKYFHVSNITFTFWNNIIPYKQNKKECIFCDNKTSFQSHILSDT